MKNLEYLEIQSSDNIDSSVIWLHGLGADGYDFEPVVHELGMPSTRFILPHAPYRPVTLNNGYEMRAWYDILGLSIGTPQDEKGITECSQQIESLIGMEMSRGIPGNKIILAGFSQGGAMALHTAIRFTERLGGILGLSTYLPLSSHVAKERSKENQAIPIFIAHGTFDTVIELSRCKQSMDVLEQLNYSLEFHEYAMAHSLCKQEIGDIRNFLIKNLGS